MKLPLREAPRAGTTAGRGLILTELFLSRLKAYTPLLCRRHCPAGSGFAVGENRVCSRPRLAITSTVVNQESRIPLVRQACGRALVADTPLPPAVVKRPARRQKNENARPVRM